MEQTECSETSAYKLQTPGNHPKQSIQHSGHGESLKSRLSLSSSFFLHCITKYETQRNIDASDVAV